MQIKCLDTCVEIQMLIWSRNSPERNVHDGGRFKLYTHVALHNFAPVNRLDKNVCTLHALKDGTKKCKSSTGMIWYIISSQKDHECAL